MSLVLIVTGFKSNKNLMYLIQDPSNSVFCNISVIQAHVRVREFVKSVTPNIIFFYKIIITTKVNFFLVTIFMRDTCVYILINIMRYTQC